MRFLVFIPHYGDPGLMERCLRSVTKHSGDDARIVALCQGGVERSIDMPGVEWVFTKHNRGFGRAVNDALRSQAQDEEFYVLLNSDAVVGEGWLERLVDPMERNEKIVITGPEGGCRTITETGDGSPGKPGDYIEGSCMMIRASAWRELEGFDVDTFQFAYGEDADLCLRARELGYSLGWVELPGYHHERSGVAQAMRERFDRGEDVIDVRGHAVINNIRLARRWRRYLESGTIRRVAILHRSGALGDVLWMTALGALVEKHARSWFLYADTPYPEMFDNNDWIRAFPEAGLGEPAELIELDGSYELDTAGTLIEGYAQRLGKTLFGEIPLPEVFFESAAERKATLVVHPGPSTWQGKSLEPGFFDEPVTQWLEAHPDWKAVCVGAPDAPLPANCEDKRGLTIRQTMEVIRRASLFWGPDAFPATVAYATRTPCVVLFGAVPPERVLGNSPLELRHGADPGMGFIRVVRAERYACLGCHLEYEPPRVDSRCAREPDCQVAPCMRDIPHDRILEASEEVIK